MKTVRDRLDAIGVVVGVFVMLVGIGTLWGQPWQYSVGGVLVPLLTVVGSLGAVAIGAGMVYLAHVVEA